MRPTFIRAAVLAALALSTLSVTASAQLALRVDFGAYTPGAGLPTVQSPIPGDPEGDAVLANASSTAIRVVENAGDLADQPLMLTHSGSGGSPKCWFYLDPSVAGARVYRVRWRSVALDIQAGTFITFRNGQTLLGSLDYRGGSRFTFGGANNDLAASFQVGVSQQFEMFFDMDQDLTRLWIDGVEVSVIQPNFGETAQIERIGFEMSGQLAQNFALDDLEVLVNSAAVSTDAPTWTEVKLRFED